MLAGFLGVMRGHVMVAVGDVGVMPRLLMISRGVMFRGRAVVASGMFVMFGCFDVVIGAFFRHGSPFGKWQFGGSENSSAA